MDLKNEYLNKKVLITGGGGFIGSNLAIKLVDLGADVSIMDAKLKPYGFNLFNLQPVSDKIKIDYSDIRDKSAVYKNILGKDIIFNLAAQVGEKISEEKPGLDWDINISGHKNVLEACEKYNKDARILFPGSRLQYGKTNVEIVPESHPMNPLSNYAKNKVIGEKMYLNSFEENNLETVMFRIANPFGPRALISNPGYCIANWFIGRALKQENLPIYGDGTQGRDYIFIDDLTEAMAIAGVHKDSPGQIYNLGSGQKSLFRDMAQKIVELSENGTYLKFIDWPEDAKKRETGDFVADISKIKKDLGWEPKISLEEGLKKTIEYYQDNIKYYETD